MTMNLSHPTRPGSHTFGQDQRVIVTGPSAGFRQAQPTSSGQAAAAGVARGRTQPARPGDAQPGPGAQVAQHLEEQDDGTATGEHRPHQRGALGRASRTAAAPRGAPEPGAGDRTRRHGGAAGWRLCRPCRRLYGESAARAESGVSWVGQLVSQRQFVERLRALGFEGPYAGERHPQMRRGEITLIMQ